MAELFDDILNAFINGIHGCKEPSIGDEIPYTASNGEVYMIRKDFNGYSYRKKTSIFPLMLQCSSAYECRKEIEAGIKEERQRQMQYEAQENRKASRRQELMLKFEQSGRKQNYASTEEVGALLNLTEKKIIQQCKRSVCHGCKLGWICPKYWSK